MIGADADRCYVFRENERVRRHAEDDSEPKGRLGAEESSKPLWANATTIGSSRGATTRSCCRRTRARAGVDALDHLGLGSTASAPRSPSQQDCHRPRHRARSPERAERSAPRGNESTARCRRRWAAGAATEAPVMVSDNAAASMRLTVRRINELVRKLSARKHVMDLDG